MKIITFKANDNIICRVMLDATYGHFIQAVFPQVPNEPEQLYLFRYDEPVLELESCDRLMNRIKELTI